MNKVVRGADGRMWNIQSQMEWTHPMQLDEFEHDVSGGRGPGILLSVVLGSLVLLLLFWRPPEVYIPAWLILALFLVIVFFPARWVLRRPWTLVADTQGDGDEHPSERWAGVVRGVFLVRQETAKVSRHIEVYSEPDQDGVLQPVDQTAS
ncbi:DUF983 domain-containing protein [Actinoalloteichus hymeniacidonis]|uniref:Uncharacterized protein n=1 Tax=Actinoalloteichus hymeniacidonis TaxID=340345 RepID=A0AAC9HKR8_9PSEU|nr:DUF983 domain-containing protein [Actinoalloteichus hymeniacidonis]AOS60918.1 hypothetical protein TL08_00350 [Actinoalloteichus hymeniacidonis]MBB5911082.1 hypothetical protein [Actinoalloteichus hymeniacidonis]